METRSFTRAILWVLSGLIVWSVHFLIVYPFNALACARGFATARVFDVDVVPFTILCVTIAALVLIAAVLSLSAREGMRTANEADAPGRFLQRLALGIGALSAVAIILETVPVMMIPPCG